MYIKIYIIGVACCGKLDMGSEYRRICEKKLKKSKSDCLDLPGARARVLALARLTTLIII